MLKVRFFIHTQRYVRVHLYHAAPFSTGGLNVPLMMMAFNFLIEEAIPLSHIMVSRIYACIVTTPVPSAVEAAKHMRERRSD